MTTQTRERNVYAELERLRKAARDALDEINTLNGEVADLTQQLTENRKEFIAQIKSDMKNMQAVLEIMAANNPALYEWAAKKHNLM